MAGENGLNDDGISLVKDLCKMSHPSDVLRAVAEYCDDMANHAHASNMGAIGNEWARASMKIKDAIDLIEP